MEVTFRVDIYVGQNCNLCLSAHGQVLFRMQVLLGRLIAIIYGSMDSLGTYMGVGTCLGHYGIHVYIHKTTMTPLSVTLDQTIPNHGLQEFHILLCMIILNSGR